MNEEMSKLRDHQLLMLKMLHEVDRICKKHDIKYSLFAGTMLGAVRHEGFIPWDDDLDIIMPRDEYERFLKVAPTKLDCQEYYLQKEFSEHWPMFFSKLRKNETACIERYIPKDPETHMGVYIDIFPLDNLLDIRVGQYIQFIASKIVIAKALDARGYLTDNLLKRSILLLCRFIPITGSIKIVKQLKAGKSEYVHSFFGAASKFSKNRYNRKWVDKTIDLKFEDGFFPVFENYHEILTVIYGDYMKPTPVEQRGCKIHAEVVDLENSYKKYKGIQNTMSFKEQSKSIR